jgi:hypothetical protein
MLFIIVDIRYVRAFLSEWAMVTAQLWSRGKIGEEPRHERSLWNEVVNVNEVDSKYLSFAVRK